MLRRVVVALAVVGFVAPLPSASADEGPTLSVRTAILEDALHCPDGFVHPEHEPVLLVHGTTVTGYENWGWNYVPAMSGFDVCYVDLPNRAMDDIQVASEYVVYGVRSIARRTGSKVDVAGLSQGGLEPRWAVKWWPDVRALVDDLVDMVTPNHGINADGLCAVSCPAAIWQMDADSNFLAALNADDETPGDISWTSVFSATDPIVTPQLPDSTSRLDGASNIYVQDICPGRPVDHVQSAYDAVFFAVVVDAFTRLGPADPSRIDRSTCTQVHMPGVDPIEATVRHALVYPIAFPMAMGITYPGVPAEPELAEYARG